MTTQMELSEARRRFEKLLVNSGYSMTGQWLRAPYKDEKVYVSSMALTNMSDTRAILWREGDGWAVMVAIAVGEEGEFPIMGNRLTRWNSDKWKPQSFKSLKERIDLIRAQVRRWDSSPTGSLGYIAMISLALSYLREGVKTVSWSKVRKGISVLLGSLRGEISEATVSESLSIVQYRWCKSREERLRSALIWASTFK